MIRRKKHRFRFVRNTLFFFAFLGCVGVLVWQRAALVSLWRNILLVRNAPDVFTALRGLRRDPFGVLCVKSADASDDCYAFDGEGIVFNAARTVVGDAIVRVDDWSPEHPMIGAPLIGADSWRNIAPVIRFVRDGGFGDVSRIVLKRPDRELDVIFGTDTTTARFSFEFDPSTHLRAIPVFVAKVPLASLEYLDMRVEGKIFYK